MEKGKVYTAIGLMSGTSLDGVDAALIRTDGRDFAEPAAFFTLPYDPELRERLRACLGRREDETGYVVRVEHDMTQVHAACVDWLLSRAGMAPAEIDVVGFHGQTVFHDPAHGFTWQIGNGALLARKTGIDVVGDFRSADVGAGGEGAPLLPLYHRARVAGLEKPVAVLNIGGVANVTWLGAGADDILAFDTGPGNALLDDWVKRRFGRDFDENGMIARQGRADEAALAAWLSHPYFARHPPKSLDRDAWDLSALENLGPADGAATLAAFTVRAAAKARDHLPAPPRAWYVTGGGRRNAFLMEELQKALAVPVAPVDDLGWNGDSLEAEGFAYLAVRSLLGLPLSLPGTTGVKAPQTGGVLHRAA